MKIPDKVAHGKKRFYIATSDDTALISWMSQVNAEAFVGRTALYSRPDFDKIMGIVVVTEFGKHWHIKKQ